MNDIELMYLAELCKQANIKAGVISANYSAINGKQIHFREDAFLKRFKEYEVKPFMQGDYERTAMLGDIKCFCLVDEADLNEKDKEELEWCGELQK